MTNGLNICYHDGSFIVNYKAYLIFHNKANFVSKYRANFIFNHRANVFSNYRANFIFNCRAKFFREMALAPPTYRYRLHLQFLHQTILKKCKAFIDKSLPPKYKDCFFFQQINTRIKQYKEDMLRPTTQQHYSQSRPQVLLGTQTGCSAVDLDASSSSLVKTLHSNVSKLGCIRSN